MCRDPYFEENKTIQNVVYVFQKYITRIRCDGSKTYLPWDLLYFGVCGRAKLDPASGVKVQKLKSVHVTDRIFRPYRQNLISLINLNALFNCSYITRKRSSAAKEISKSWPLSFISLYIVRTEFDLYDCQKCIK